MFAVQMFSDYKLVRRTLCILTSARFVDIIHRVENALIVQSLQAVPQVAALSAVTTRDASPQQNTASTQTYSPSVTWRASWLRWLIEPRIRLVCRRYGIDTGGRDEKVGSDEDRWIGL